MTALHVSDAPPEDLLRIYLEDHLTAAIGGRRLARRVLVANRGTPYEDGLQRLVVEIDEEWADLRSIVRHHGRRWSVTPVVKAVAVVAGERLGRLKLNGQLRGYSPLSRLVELEALGSSVQGKRALWWSLQTLDGDDVLPEGVDLERLARQADDQLLLLRTLHDRAAGTAFAAA